MYQILTLLIFWWGYFKKKFQWHSWLSFYSFPVHNSMTEAPRKKDKPTWPSWHHMVDVAQDLGEHSEL